MKDEHKHCWNCEDEDRCNWPPECVCERWWPELVHEGHARHKCLGQNRES